jgi:orotidine-5'-phosphate decarboxylase
MHRVEAIFLCGVTLHRTMRRQHGVILALDETDPSKARAVASAVAPHVDAIKINWPLVLSAGPAMITELSQLCPVICDFKLADIPNTNRLITEQAVKRGAAGVIVQGFPGMDSVKAVVDAAAGAAVFVVTEMSHPGGQEFTAPVADRIARMAVEAKASGVIAPATRPGRISEIRKIVGSLSILSPGVGAQGGSAADAIRAGADYVIVGRSIYASPDPAKAAREISGEVCSAMKK